MDGIIANLTAYHLRPKDMDVNNQDRNMPFNSEQISNHVVRYKRPKYDKMLNNSKAKKPIV